MKKLQNEGSALYQAILAECLDNINSGVEKCIKKCKGTDRMMDSRFGASIEEIISTSRSSAVEFLAFLLRPKYAAFSALHGLSASGRVRGVGTVVEINVELQCPFELEESDIIFKEFETKKLLRPPNKSKVRTGSVFVMSESQVRNLSPKKLKELIVSQGDTIKELNLEIIDDAKQQLFSISLDRYLW